MASDLESNDDADILMKTIKFLALKVQRLEQKIRGSEINRRLKRQATNNNDYCNGFPGPVGPAGPPGLTVRQLEDFYKNLKQPKLEGSQGGVTYIRWGRTTCGSDAEKLYDGKVGGNYHNHPGGGANYLCMHNEPQWRNKTGGKLAVHGRIDGTEFEAMDQPHLFEKTNAQSLNNNDATCAVCYSDRRVAKVMIPGRRTCNAGWTKEYEGYLVTGHWNYKANHVYECLDLAPEVVLGTSRDTHASLMYIVTVVCIRGSLCPKYVRDNAVTCVVCTK